MFLPKSDGQQVTKKKKKKAPAPNSKSTFMTAGASPLPSLHSEMSEEEDWEADDLEAPLAINKME